MHNIIIMDDNIIIFEDGGELSCTIIIIYIQMICWTSETQTVEVNVLFPACGAS